MQLLMVLMMLQLGWSGKLSIVKVEMKTLQMLKVLRLLQETLVFANLLPENTMVGAQWP